MPITTAIPGDAKEKPAVGRRRFTAAKGAIALGLVLALTYVGHEGRRQARLQASLDDLDLVRDQLQQALDEQPQPIGLLAGRLRAGTAEESPSASAKPEVQDLADALLSRLAGFDAAYGPRDLAEAQALEARLAKATLANAQQRFAEALTTLTAEDEQGREPGTSVQSGRQARVLQLRGDSFFGLRQWREALDRYQRASRLRPSRLSILARIADCHYALGGVGEAAASGRNLASAHNLRGNVLLLRGQWDAALAHYTQAVAIQSQLLEEGNPAGLTNDLAHSHSNRGNALLLLGKPEAALNDYDRAISLRSQLAQPAGGTETAEELAVSYNDRGNAYLALGQPAAASAAYQQAIEIQRRLTQPSGPMQLANELEMSLNNRAGALFGQQNVPAAIDHYDQAIDIGTRLLKSGAQSEVASRLALCLNNRGVLDRAQGKLEPALRDFDRAIQTLSPLPEPPPPAPAALAPEPAASLPPLRLKLDVAMSYTEEGIEALTLTRLMGREGRGEPAVALAISLNNRGYLRLVEGKLEEAMVDLERSASLYRQVVTHGGNSELASQFAAALSPLAWTWATHPARTRRDGPKAKQYALQACALTDWKAFVPLEVLAAACAETGDFAAAVKWQESALELAPDQAKSRLRPVLELYRSGRPYRVRLPR